MRRLLLVAAASLLLGAQDPTPEGARKAVRAFYTAHFKGPMGFDAKTLKAKKPFLAPDFYQALVAKAAEAAGNPDEAPDIDGDPFTQSQEYPDAFTVGKAQASGGSVRVQVRFTWKNGNPARSLVVVMKNGTDGWRVDDFRYGEGDTLRGLAGRKAAPPSAPK